MTNEQLFAFIKRNPLPIGCALLSLGLGAGVYFRGGEIPEVTEEVIQKTAEADRHEANKKNAAQLKEQLEAVTAANKEIASRLVRGAEIAANYQYFFKLIDEAGVKQLELRQSAVGAVKPGQPKPNFVPVGFAISVQGELPALLKFLTLVESGARFARVMGASCGVPPTDRAAPVTLTLNLELLGQP